MNEGQASPHGRTAVHQPVLVRQVLQVLDPQPGMVCLDCTVGLGGHGQAIAPRLAPGGRYIGLDVDPGNIALAQGRLGGSAVRVDLVRANFATALAVLNQLGVAGVDLVLADLGFASDQVSDPVRGLSFSAEGPLDMRLDPDGPVTAASLVNALPERELADLIHRFGQERLSRKIARKIAERRRQSPIKTTTELAQLVRRAYGPKPRKGRAHGRHRIDPATRTFMALRIAVNAELAALDQLLGDLPRMLRPGAVAAIIAFHSLEDRPVKLAFARWCRDRRAELLTRKPLVADDDQRRANSRSRSAKLRAIRWIDAQAQPAADC